MLGLMDGTETAAMVLALAFVVLGLAVVIALRNLTRSMDALRRDVESLSAGAPTLADLRAAVTAAIDPAVDDEPGPPRRVTRVPGAFRSPGVIKAMALGTGTASAARRLRQGVSNGHGNGKGSN